MTNQSSNPNKNNEPKKSYLNSFIIFFFITLGIVFILNIFGILPLGLWEILWRFWPVFLFMVVLQLFAKKLPILRIIVASLGAGVVASIIFLSTTNLSKPFEKLLDNLSPTLSTIENLIGIDPGEKLTSQLVLKEEEYKNVKTREIKIDIAFGDFNLTDSPLPEYAIVNSQYYEKFGRPSLNGNLADEILKIDLITQRGILPIFGKTPDTKYDISIGQIQIPTSFDINAGASSFNAIFNELKIDSLKIAVGAGAANIAIGQNSLAKNMDLEVGAGTLKMKLPSSAFAKITYAVGLGVLKVDSTTLTSSGSYTIPNFKITQDPFEIKVKLGAGTMIIETTGEN